MSSTFFRPMYEKQGHSPEELALDMENCCITVPAFIPWCILCSVPLHLLDVPYKALGYAVFLYAVPLTHLIRKLFTQNRNSLEIP